MIYILNTLIVPIDFDKYPSVVVKLSKITVDEAKSLLRSDSYMSAIGHEATAQFLSLLLGKPIRHNRISVFMKPGDIGLHLFLKTRLPEGKILSLDEIQNYDYNLIKSEVIQT